MTEFQTVTKARSTQFLGLYLSWDGAPEGSDTKALTEIWENIFKCYGGSGFRGVRVAALRRFVSLPTELFHSWNREDFRNGFPLLVGDPSDPKPSPFFGKLWRNIKKSNSFQMPVDYLITPFLDQAIWEIGEEQLVPFVWERDLTDTESQDTQIVDLLSDDSKLRLKDFLAQSLGLLRAAPVQEETL